MPMPSKGLSGLVRRAPRGRLPRGPMNEGLPAVPYDGAPGLSRPRPRVFGEDRLPDNPMTPVIPDMLDMRGKTRPAGGGYGGRSRAGMGTGGTVDLPDTAGGGIMDLSPAERLRLVARDKDGRYLRQPRTMMEYGDRLRYEGSSQYAMDRRDILDEMAPLRGDDARKYQYWRDEGGMRSSWEKEVARRQAASDTYMAEVKNTFEAAQKISGETGVGLGMVLKNADSYGLNKRHARTLLSEHDFEDLLPELPDRSIGASRWTGRD